MFGGSWNHYRRQRAKQFIKLLNTKWITYNLLLWLDERTDQQWYKGTTHQQLVNKWGCRIKAPECREKRKELLTLSLFEAFAKNRRMNFVIIYGNFLVAIMNIYFTFLWLLCHPLYSSSSSYSYIVFCGAFVIYYFAYEIYFTTTIHRNKAE